MSQTKKSYLTKCRLLMTKRKLGFPGDASDKNPPANAGGITDVASVPLSGRPFGGGHSCPLQFSCLESHMDRGAWQTLVHRVAKSQTQLSTQARAKGN